LVTLHWLLTVAAVLTAAWALARLRRVSRRLDRLTESYWELKYDHGQLRARVARLDPEAAGPAAGTPSPKPGTPGSTAFVPLSSLKR
jgi:hypothetical protein